MDWSGLPRRRKQKKRNKGKPKDLLFLAVNIHITNIRNIANISFKLTKHLRKIILEYPSIYNE